MDVNLIDYNFEVLREKIRSLEDELLRKNSQITALEDKLNLAYKCIEDSKNEFNEVYANLKKNEDFSNQMSVLADSVMSVCGTIFVILTGFLILKTF